MIKDQISSTTEKAESFFFRASAEDFKKIPGGPIAYWVSSNFCNTFLAELKIGSDAKKGLSCSGTELFYRNFWEVASDNCSFNNGTVWYPITKGGNFRKWYGNNEYLINWEYNGSKIKKRVDQNGKPLAAIRNEKFYLKAGISWNDVSSGKLSCRYIPTGSIPTDSGPVIYSANKSVEILSFLNSCVSKAYTDILCPTIHFGVGQIAEFPLSSDPNINNLDSTEYLISLSKTDWDSYETSWDFDRFTLLQPHHHKSPLKNTYQKLRIHWQETTLEMQRLEEENNRIFIDAYDLQDELTPDMPLEEITLTCNPYYRYKKKVESGEQEVGSDGKKIFPFDPDLEERLLADTMKEFMSYAVGCMFGRYSLDAPGLILANQGEGLEDYFRIIKEKGVRGQGLGASENQNQSNPSPLTPNPSFTPDADNVIPILDDNWFTDDIVERFQRFLRVTFGDEHYEENLKFIEDAIGKSIRKYFLKDFYKDHVKTYKKRPIYWLFSSPKGNFNALIYMHRYRPDTVSVILNDYLREFRTKLIARKEHLEKVSISATADNREKTTALKESEKLAKIIDELNDYETNIYDLATKNIEIDLDDGVKTNYPKFGIALKKIPGLS